MTPMQLPIRRIMALFAMMCVTLPAFAQKKPPVNKKKEPPKAVYAGKPLVKADSVPPPPYRDDVFTTGEIERMKTFLINNASKPAQPKTKRWSPAYSLVCINTVRAGVEYLLYHDSAIPDSLFSRNAAFNAFGRANRIDVLMQQLQDSGLVSKSRVLGLSGLNRRKIVPIDSMKSYLDPYELDGSLWFTLRGMIGNVSGWSVFTISLCTGTHAAILTVDHREPDKMLVYWSDQTHNHPVISGGKATTQYGWELMNEKGSVKTTPRGLDAYTLHAMKTFWCDCTYDKKDKNAKVGACFPEVVIWRIGRGQL